MDFQNCECVDLIDTHFGLYVELEFSRPLPLYKDIVYKDTSKGGVNYYHISADDVKRYNSKRLFNIIPTNENTLYFATIAHQVCIKDITMQYKGYIRKTKIEKFLNS
jgi:hypothetical protein